MLAADERHVLETIAGQLGMSVRSLTLSAELQAATQRLVGTREEERRRLQRDLHDGLGPALAAQMLVVSSARRSLETDPEHASALLGKLELDIHATLAQLRSLVHGLRPPVLDQLGLEGALRQRLRKLVGDTPRLELTFPAVRVAYPAAVEVAAYYIATEAVANVVRHAQAGVCQVELKVDGVALELSVTDDGVGFSEPRYGVGLSSMRARAQELGGALKISSGQVSSGRVSCEHPGTRVWVSLPFLKPERRRSAQLSLPS